MFGPKLSGGVYDYKKWVLTNTNAASITRMMGDDGPDEYGGFSPEYYKDGKITKTSSEYPIGYPRKDLLKIVRMLNKGEIPKAELSGGGDSEGIDFLKSFTTYMDLYRDMDRETRALYERNVLLGLLEQTVEGRDMDLGAYDTKESIMRNLKRFDSKEYKEMVEIFKEDKDVETLSPLRKSCFELLSCLIKGGDTGFKPEMGKVFNSKPTKASPRAKSPKKKNVGDLRVERARRK